MTPDNGSNKPDPAQLDRRRRYVAPSLVETAEFETLALACAKLDGQTLACSLDAGAS